VSLTFHSLIISEGEEEDNVDNNTKDLATAANKDDDEEDNNNHAPKGEAHGRGSSIGDCREKTKRQMRSLYFLPPSCPL
jgi:hypothetical protein